MEKAKSMIVGIRAWLRVGSHVEEVCEQVRGRDLDLPTKGKERKDKSRDTITSLNGWGC